jgi:hypothetical protein
MQQQRHSLTVEIDDLEIFGANSQSVILVVRGYELVVVATHWESVRNAMLMCEKFSPFEVSSSSKAHRRGGGDCCKREARRPIMGCQERVGGAPILKGQYSHLMPALCQHIL